MVYCNATELHVAPPKDFFQRPQRDLSLRRSVSCVLPAHAGRPACASPRERRPLVLWVQSYLPESSPYSITRGKVLSPPNRRCGSIPKKGTVLSSECTVVTGGAGFIGSHLCEVLLRDGRQVLAVDNFSTGRRKNVAHLLGQPGFALLEHDICEPLLLDTEVGLVFHLASPASPVDFSRLPLEILRVNSQGTWNALALAERSHGRFVLASTSEVYGDPLEHPQRETYWGNVNPTGPRSAYDEAKRFAEALTVAYRRRHGLSTGIARIFNSYGPRMRRDDGRVVPTFISQALEGKPLTVFGDGNQTRSFCYVGDMVGGLIALADADHPGPINLGNPQEMTISDLARMVVELTASKSPIALQPAPADDPRRRRPDISLSRDLLGWVPSTSPEAGLAKTIEYMRRETAGKSAV
ncbi:MAG: SDR family oxidoreductase [Armatimonadota bacterium]|nr:MAG: SDR family oxidoreductase [Armatimonadota bacterium]